MLEVPQDRVVLTTDCQEHDAGFPYSIFMMRHVHHVRKRLGGQFRVSAAHHHVEAAAQQADGQAFGEVARTQDGHRGLRWQTGSSRISNAVLQAVGQETGLGVVEVLRGGGCEEHWTPAATHHGERIHPSPFTSSVVFYKVLVNLMEENI